MCQHPVIIPSPFHRERSWSSRTMENLSKVTLRHDGHRWIQNLVVMAPSASKASTHLGQGFQCLVHWLDCHDLSSFGCLVLFPASESPKGRNWWPEFTANIICDSFTPWTRGWQRLAFVLPHCGEITPESYCLHVLRAASFLFRFLSNSSSVFQPLSILAPLCLYRRQKLANIGQKEK